MIYSFLWAFLLNCFMHTSMAAETLHQLPIVSWKTTNNIPVYFVQENEVPMLQIRCIWDAGSARDNSLPGLAALTNRTIGTGSFHLSTEAIANRFAMVGAQFGTSVDREKAIVDLKTLSDSEKLMPALDTFIQILQEPAFPIREIDRERNHMLMELRSIKENPDAVASRAFTETIYADHPYGHSVIGNENSIKHITAAQIQRFYKQYYVAHNTIIVMVGAIDRTTAEMIAEKIGKTLHNGEAPKPLPLANSLKQARAVHIPYNSTQTQIVIGTVSITEKDPDLYALYVGNMILGDDGLTSLLADQIRVKEGLAYHVNSILTPALARGIFAIRLQTRNAQAEHAQKSVMAVLAQFNNKKLNPNDVAATQKTILNRIPLMLANNEGILAMLTQIAFYHRPLDYLQQFQKCIMAVTPESIAQAWQKHVASEPLATITVGPNA